jgi:hypothetical protein
MWYGAITALIAHVQMDISQSTNQWIRCLKERLLHQLLIIFT